jgi:phosphoribosylformylglycinamidine synthase
MVRDGTVVRPGSDAAVVRILTPERGDTGKSIALTTDCNHRFCYLDPYEGARLAVAEAYRNLACTGAEPLAVTDCLNFGNPERPEIMWQLAECVRGLGDACRALGTPVVSGNVSLYNETEGRAILPTPTVGMVGLLEDVTVALGAGFPSAGLVVALLGVNTEELGGSQYLATVHGRIAGLPPRLDVERERAVGQACMALVRARLIRSAHDCSEGGLAVALAEACLVGPGPVGVSAELAGAAGADGALRPDALLFGEAPSRIVISFAPEDTARVEAVVAEYKAPFSRLGTTGGQRIRFTSGGRALVDVALAEAARAYREGFRRIVEG